MEERAGYHLMESHTIEETDTTDACSSLSIFVQCIIEAWVRRLLVRNESQKMSQPHNETKLTSSNSPTQPKGPYRGRLHLTMFQYCWSIICIGVASILHAECVLLVFFEPVY